MSAYDKAVAILLREHRSLALVLRAMQTLLHKIEARHAAPEFDLLAATLFYIGDFQERCHHPKEDEYWFKVLGAAAPGFSEQLGALHADHVRSTRAVAQLHRGLVRYQAGACDGLARLKADVDNYATQMLEHMREEEVLLARSRDALREADWACIAAAFTENDDPLFGGQPRDEFGRLFQRIQLLMPRKLKAALYRQNDLAEGV